MAQTRRVGDGRRAQRPSGQAFNALDVAILSSHLSAGVESIEEIPRTTDYMTATSRLHHVGPGRIKQWGLSHSASRKISRESLINAAIHMRRAHGIRQFACRWDGQRHSPGLTIQHRDHNRPGVDVSRIDGLQERIRRAEALFFDGLTRNFPMLDQVLPALTDDHLTIDRACINVLWSQVGDRPVRWAPVDGASILPVTIWADMMVATKARPGASEWERWDVAQRSTYLTHGIDLRDVHYVQIDASRGIFPISWLRDSDLLVGIANPSTDMTRQGYGLSPCEASWVASSMYLFGINYVLDFFKNATGGMLGTIKGVPVENAKAFVDGLRTQYTGSHRQHLTPFFVTENAGAEIDFKAMRGANAQQMEYAETIHQAVMLCAAFYAEDPSNINIQQRGPGSGAALSEPNRDQEQSLKRSEGLINNIRFLCRSLFTPLVQMLDPDLCVVPCGIDDKKEEAEVELRKSRVQTWMSIDEARIEEGKKPFGEEWSKYPAPQAAVMFNQMANLQMQQAQQQMGLGQPGPPGQGGDEDDEGDGGQSQGGPGDDDDQKSPPEHLRLGGDDRDGNDGRPGGPTEPTEPETGKAVLTVEWSA
jgi:hypothetical protein